MKTLTVRNMEVSKQTYRHLIEETYLHDEEDVAAHPMFIIQDGDGKPLLFGSYAVTEDKEHQRRMEALACMLWAGLPMAESIIFNMDAFVRNADGTKPSDAEMLFKGLIVTTGCDKDDPIDPETVFEEYTVRTDEVVFEPPVQHDPTKLEAAIHETLKKAPGLFREFVEMLAEDHNNKALPIEDVDGFVEVNKMFHDLGGVTEPSDAVWRMVETRLVELMAATEVTDE